MQRLGWVASKASVPFRSYWCVSAATSFAAACIVVIGRGSLRFVPHLQIAGVAQGVETVDHIGAVRVFGVGDKMLFEQLVKLDNQDMIMQVTRFVPPMRCLMPAFFGHVEQCLCLAAATLSSK